MTRPAQRHSSVLPALLLTALLACLSSGCALCSNCEDYTYGAYGGRWQRHDRAHGRVGSVFAPAGGRVEELPVGEQPSGEDAEPLPDEEPDDEYYTREFELEPPTELAQPESTGVVR